MIADNIKAIQEQLGDAKLVVVSKYRTISELKEVYDCGIRDMGENRVQHLMDRYEALPKDIRWHMIGHLQTNKVKYIAPFIALIHSVDSVKLLNEINRQAAINQRTIPLLLQMHISDEDTKSGLDAKGLEEIIQLAVYGKNIWPNVEIQGLMGMASLTENSEKVQNEFRRLKNVFEQIKRDHNQNLPHFNILSMGMSSDYRVAILEGSNLVRIGSAIFSTN